MSVFRIFMLSIPHSGTRFVTEEVLDRLNIRFRGEHVWRRSGIASREDMLRNKDILIPLRHPKDVARSWVLRHKVLTRMREMWEVLIEDIDPIADPHYFPMDNPAIQRRTLTDLSLGRADLSVWTSTTERGESSKVILTDEQETLCDDLLAKYPDFFNQFWKQAA